MTNVAKQNSWKEMITFKQNQAESNLDEILETLDELKNPSSPTQIRDHMKRKANEKATKEANEKYESGEITKTDRDKYIKKFGKTMSIRTIQRWLARYTAHGYVAYTYNGYYLLAKGKREIQFRSFAKGYGIMALNSLLDLHFPTLNTIEENLQKLIDIFGIYVVYCLIEAARLITAEKNDREDHWKSSYFGNETNFDRQGKFSERKLVNSWIMHIFNPINILNLFLVSISNSSGDDKKDMDENEAVLKYSRYLDRNQMNTFKQNTFRQTSKETDLDVGDIDFPPTTLDLFYKRISSNHGNQDEPISAEYWKQKPDLHPHLIHSYYDQSILYDLNEETITKLKEFLKNRYPTFYNRLEIVNEFFYSSEPSRQ